MTNVLIYGAGAIGSFIGYILADSLPTKGQKIENVALLGRKSHMQRIEEFGLQIYFPDGKKSARFKRCFTSLHELRSSDFYPDIVIICVKTYSLPGVYDDIKESDMLQTHLKNASFILLMNGMGNREVFDQLDLPMDRIYEGITSFGVKFSIDGQIELKGMGKTVLEERINVREKEFLKARFEEKDFEIEFSPDFKKDQWNKLIVNSVINPISALTGKENRIILSDHLRETVKNIVKECVIVAGKEGIKADYESVLENVYSVAKRTSQNTCSMLQDVKKEKMTEIDSINGYVIRLAKKQEIDVPVNETLYGLVKSLSSDDFHASN
jgi:2-dehydropantoate 2-reductase